VKSRVKDKSNSPKDFGWVVLEMF